jgi:hypothetical protein
MKVARLNISHKWVPNKNLPVARRWILFIAPSVFSSAYIVFFLLGIHFISIDFIENIT